MQKRNDKKPLADKLRRQRLWQDVKKKQPKLGKQYPNLSSGQQSKHLLVNCWTSNSKNYIDICESAAILSKVENNPKKSWKLILNQFVQTKKWSK